MPACDWYQRESDSHTALILAEVRRDEPPGFIIARFGQEAYELIHTGVYIQELIRAKNDPDYLCWAPGFELFYDTVSSLKGSGPIVFEEIGSTLFSTIDKMEKMARRRGHALAGRFEYLGVEPMMTFQHVAEMCHPTDAVRHVKFWRELGPAAPVTVSRCYQASSYAFETTGEFASWVARSSVSLQGAWFRPGAGEKTISMLGKRVQLFDYASFISLLRAAGRETAVISSELYTYKGEMFICAWLMCFLTALSGHQGLCALDSPASLAPTNEPREHAGGLDASQGAGRATFNFDTVGLNSAFDDFLASGQ